MIEEGQLPMFPEQIQTTHGPLGLWLYPHFMRLPRQRCSNCGLRRIVFAIGLGDTFRSAPFCAKCAGIR
jgi:hypothetical protein